jgi:hypothetical protein
MIARIAIAVAFLACPVAWSGELLPLKSDKPPIPGVEVELRFSLKELDPLKPPEKDYLECIVRNKSEKAVRAPTKYTGGFQGMNMLLWADGRWPLTMHNWAGEKEQVMKPLNPKEEVVVFKMGLTELFLLADEKEKPLKPKEPRVYWSWPA